MIRTAVGKVLTAKVAAVVAATTIGGVAVAAGTGNLPTQHQGTPSTQASHSAQPAQPTPTKHPTGSPSAEPPRNGDHTASPSPSMIGLCRAFAAGAGHNPGKALENPAFTALVTAAGSRDKVTAFCGSVLAQAAPHPSGHPTGHPTGKPEPRHSGHLTAHPTAPVPHPTPATPTTHPTGP